MTTHRASDQVFPAGDFCKAIEPLPQLLEKKRVTLLVFRPEFVVVTDQARIFPINIHAVKVIFRNNINAAIGKCVSRCIRKQWEAIGSGSNRVKRIEAITWKPVSGSTDVFPAQGPDSPKPVSGRQNRVWQAKVNNITNDVAYVYSIKFVRDDPRDTTVYTFDPIISIKPSTKLVDIIFRILGFIGVCLSGLFYWRMKRMEIKMKRMEINNEKK